MRTEASFSLSTAHKVLDWLEQLILSLMGQGWTKKDLQCLSEVPAASRAALRAMENWAWDIVEKPIGSIIDVSPIRMVHDKTCGIIRLWSNYRQSQVCPDDLPSYIQWPDIQSSEYRHDVIGLQFDHYIGTDIRTIAAVIGLDIDASCEMMRVCAYDLYLLRDDGFPIMLFDRNSGFATTVEDFVENIHSAIHAFEASQNKST